jgi:UDP-GlcNAc:undecaprenyl-phosphate GlcNAc-1-phosphate transferase
MIWLDYLLVILVSVIFTLICVRLVLRYFPKLGLMDRPEKYGYNRAAVPYSAGVILVLVFFLIALSFLPFDQKLLGLVIGAVILALVSFWDDRKGLSPYLRLFVQVFVALLVVLSGSQIFGFNLPGFGFLELGVLGGGVATVVWIVLVINMLNWLDGVPGLSLGVSGVGFLALFALSVLPHFHTLPQAGVAYLSLGLGASALVLMFFSVPKLKLLIGDTGSMFLGLMLAVLSVYAGGKVATAVLVLALPFFDTVWTILRRIKSGVSPFKGDLNHLHHRLQRLGWSNWKICLFFVGVSTLFAFLALNFLSTERKLFMAVVIFAMLSLLAILIVYFDGNKRRD